MRFFNSITRTGNLRKWSFVFMTMLGVGVLLSACKKERNDAPEEVPAAGVMLVNLAPDLAANVNIDGNYLNTNPLGFGNYSGGYLGIYTGNRTIETYDARTGTLVDSSSQEFVDGQYYSLFLLGMPDSYNNLLVNDDFDALSPQSGKSFVRYINAIPDAMNTSISFRQNDQDMINETVAYMEISDFMPVNTRSVDIMLTGDANLSASRTLSFEEQKAYTILLTGKSQSNNMDSVQIRYIENGMLDNSPMTNSVHIEDTF